MQSEVEIKELRYKTEVEKTGEYEYIRSYRMGDILPNGKSVKVSPYIQIKHKYCGSVYEILANNFINKGQRCGKCCGSYENSFAHHVEVELGEPLDKYWDLDKNTVNPYHISKYKNGKTRKGKNTKVWIKCAKVEYHNSYEVSCANFTNGYRCPYCRNQKVHPKDSFAQYHIDNTDPNFLEKYWSDKNTLNPWEISPGVYKKVWILCDKVDYHNDYGGYEINCYNFTNGSRCSYCSSNGVVPKVHLLDSFGYLHPDKAKCWHENNDKSPYEVAPGSGKKFKFRCKECGHVFNIVIRDIKHRNSWCPNCASPKGEKKICEWLDKHNINYIHDEPYFKDLLSDLGNPLRPDFILPEHKIWIEYDGEFHFKKYYESQNYEILKEHDKRKNEYAKVNGWKMIRIPYTKFDEIEEILSNELKL